MRPSKGNAKQSKSPRGQKTELARLIEACGRDERRALQSLYTLTAPTLFALAEHATSERGAAEQALLQAYLAIFEDAGRFDSTKDDPAAWLRNVLLRHLPSLPPASKSGTIEPVPPPDELWQRLDIALGLQRLDRHIKPGIATQERGRDPMPNAADRHVERQIRFWRATSGVALVALTASIGLLTLLLTQSGRLDPWSASTPGNAAVHAPQPTAARAAAAAPQAAAGSQTAAETSIAEQNEAAAAVELANLEAPRQAILQPSDESRLWHVVLDGRDLQVNAMPPFTAPGETSGTNVLILWAVADGGAAMHRLAELDPATTTHAELPDEIETKGLGFAVSLEPRDAGPAADRPQGPVLFAGPLRP
jgi:hypothetical protein